jgi:pimeloyl-ACP methyl ester carboxylesterase
MGIYDLPATIDYIIQVNGHKKVAYIGHSMGTTVMFYGLATIPDYFNEKLSVFVALGPVGAVPNTLVYPFKFVSLFYDLVEMCIDLFKLGPIFHFHEFISSAITTACFSPTMEYYCVSAIESLATIAPEYDNFDRFALMVYYYPAGSSARTLKHMLRGMKFGVLEEYTADWNDSLREKVKAYHPLNFSAFSQTKVPVIFFYSVGDALTSELDVLNLAKLVKPVVIK